MDKYFIRYQDNNGKIIESEVDQNKFIQTVTWCHKNGFRIEAMGRVD